MRFTWGEAKRRANVRNHGLDFVDAEFVFRGPVYSFEDARDDYGEQRFIGLGFLQEIVVVVAFTEPDDDLIRVISMRRATKHEQRIFFEQLAF